MNSRMRSEEYAAAANTEILDAFRARQGEAAYRDMALAWAVIRHHLCVMAVVRDSIGRDDFIAISEEFRVPMACLLASFDPKAAADAAATIDVLSNNLLTAFEKD